MPIIPTMPGSLSHTNSLGDIQMVDISDKGQTLRIARARGFLRLTQAHLAALDQLPKGDAILTAQVAGIQGGKKTSELIPLCHQVPLSDLAVNISRTDQGLQILATAKTVAQTGVEMEAYTAVVVAGVTLIDMLKGVDPDLTLTEVQLMSKKGGKSDWTRP